MSERQIDEAVKQGLIDRDYHSRLLEELPHWSRVAGVQPEDVLRPLSECCGVAEEKWFRNWDEMLVTGIYGLLYVGPFAQRGKADVAQRMRCLCGCFMRRWPVYIDARVRAVAGLDGDDIPDVPVLFVPDSAMDHSPALQRRLGACVVERASRVKATVLHLASTKDAARVLGASAGDLVLGAYVHVKTT